MTDSAIIAEVYNRLEARRKHQDITQADMAQRLNITPKSYRAISEGKCKLVTFVALVRQCGLIENMESLVPQPTLSPLEVVRKAAKSGQRQHKHSAEAGKKTTAALLSSRKPLKTK